MSDSNRKMAEILGMHEQSVHRLCRRLGVQTPGQRKKQERQTVTTSSSKADLNGKKPEPAAKPKPKPKPSPKAQAWAKPLKRKLPEPPVKRLTLEEYRRARTLERSAKPADQPPSLSYLKALTLLTS